MNEFMGHVHKLVFLVDKSADRILKEQGSISFSHFVILNVAYRCESISQGDVARFLGVSEALISRQIVRLVRLGFIKKRINPTSRRERTLQITQLGKEQYAKAQALLEKKFGHLQEHIPAKDKRSILLHLRDMLAVLEGSSRN